MTQKPILALLVLLCTFVCAAGQTKPADPPADDKDDVVKITTNLVQVDAVVTKNRRPVTNLTAEDFEIYQDGKRQTITSFAYISNISTVSSSAPDKTGSEPAARVKGDSTIPPPAPIQREVERRTFAIVVDDIGLSAESMGQVRRQLQKFIVEELQPNDLVAVIRTGGEMGALQQFTNDKRMLQRAVQLLRWNPCSRLGLATIPRVGDIRVGGCIGSGHMTTIRSLRFILKAMGDLPGRKSMIVMSDDIPIRVLSSELGEGDTIATGADVTNYGDWLQRLTETAIRSSVVVYSVDTQGLQYTGITAADSISGSIPERQPAINALIAGRFRMLQNRREGSLKLARQTGGFQVTNSNGFQLDRIMEDQSGYYLIGYRPTEETFNRKFHHITAKVKRSGMTLRTRYGFFGVTEEEARNARPFLKNETNLALLSPFGAQDLEVGLNSFFADGKTEGSTIRSFLYLNPATLTFNHANGKHETSLEVHGAIFGDNGAVVEKVKHDIILSLGESEYAQTMRDGLPDAVRLHFDMRPKRPGSYQVRIAVRDKVSARLGSAGQFVVVPDLKQKGIALSGIVLRGVSEAPPEAGFMVNPPARRFPAGSDLNFAFVIYNAALNPATGLPTLVMQTRLFRDGKPVGAEPETAVSVANGAELARLFTTGAVKLDRNLEPGAYYLQVVVTDQASRNKQPSITQWVDFEIVK
jgi:VWFA-related protein